MGSLTYVDSFQVKACQRHHSRKFNRYRQMSLNQKIENLRNWKHWIHVNRARNWPIISFCILSEMFNEKIYFVYNSRFCWSSPWQQLYCYKAPVTQVFRAAYFLSSYQDFCYRSTLSRRSKNNLHATVCFIYGLAEHFSATPPDLQQTVVSGRWNKDPLFDFQIWLLQRTEVLTIIWRTVASLYL